MRIVVRRQPAYVQLPKAVTGCSLENLATIKSTYPEGVAMFVSKPGCPDCETMREMLMNLVVPVKPVIEASLGDPACEAIADLLKVQRTPTIVYFKNGAADKRVEPDGTKGWAEFAVDLNEIAS